MLTQRGVFCYNCAMRVGLILLAMGAAWAAPGVRYLTYDDVREVALQFEEAPNAAAWDWWVRETDRTVRQRVQRGAEDSVTNLLLYGTSFTKLPRLAGTAQASEAGPRVKALAAALAGTPANERLRTAQRVVGAAGKSAAEIEKSLGANLQRFASEQAAYESKLQAASRTADEGQVLMTRATLYAQRGLSSDTSLPPNWAIEDTLRVLREKGAGPAAIRKIAVIGPGLDFADKRDGYDFYPVQTLQPFAVLEAAARQGYGDDARVTALDLNPAVLSHVSRIAKGGAYHLELPRDRTTGWKAEIVRYWEQFGGLIGSPAEGAAVPAALPHVVTRAVRLRPEAAARISAMDLNIVAQTCEERFDLIVATNILVYYDRWQQGVALANIARLLNPGGVFLSNTVLPAQRPPDLEYLGRRKLAYSATGEYGDDLVVYRKRK
jgi:SAM-dependent methyltransferase